VRANTGGRTVNIDDILATLKLPVLVAADRLILPAAAKYTAAKISGASRCTKASVMLRSGRYGMLRRRPSAALARTVLRAARGENRPRT
jgi:hypothetical protein